MEPIVLAGAGLDLVPATGGTLDRLATAPAGKRFWYPQIIAGGRAILYTSSGPRPDAGDIEVFDVANKTSRKLAARVRPAACCRPDIWCSFAVAHCGR